MAKRLQKNKVPVKNIPYSYFDLDNLDGKTIEEAVEYIQNIKKVLIDNCIQSNMPNYEDWIDNVYFYFDYGYDNDREWHLRSFRMETDEEFEERKKKNREISKALKQKAIENAAKKEAEELALFNKLKLKYENNDN